MQTLEIVAYERQKMGKSEANRLRREGYVPGVLYGKDTHKHFYAPLILFRDLIYTHKAHFVGLNIEGEVHRCILQQFQEHPVSEALHHVDFLKLYDDQPIKMKIPVKFDGTPKGIGMGGKLRVKLGNLSIKALPKDMPEYVRVNIEKLSLGDSVKVGAIAQDNFQVLHQPSLPLASVNVPRTMRGKGLAEDEEEEEGEEEAAE